MAIILSGIGWQILGMVLGWGFLLCLGYTLLSFLHETAQVSHRLHQIPCAQCRFFTNQSVLKCPVHPTTALSEQAIDCPDFALD